MSLAHVFVVREKPEEFTILIATASKNGFHVYVALASIPHIPQYISDILALEDPDDMASATLYIAPR